MLNFNQFINESKDHEFDTLEAGDKIQFAGKTYTIKKSSHGIIHIPGKEGDIKVNKGQWKERGGRVIEKSNKEDEK
jgi:hypothetical protein